MVYPAGDAAGAEKGLLEVMSGVLNYLRNRWSCSSCWERLYLAHLLHIPRGSDLYSAAAEEEKENYCTGTCCPVIEYWCERLYFRF